jgi:hypothetical protein
MVLLLVRINMKANQFCLAGLWLIVSNAYAQDPSVIIATQTGNAFGLTLSGYQHKEPSLDVVISAPLLGVDYTVAYAFGNDWFVKADALCIWFC